MRDSNTHFPDWLSLPLFLSLSLSLYIYIYIGRNDKIVVLKKTTLHFYFKTFIEKNQFR